MQPDGGLSYPEISADGIDAILEGWAANDDVAVKVGYEISAKVGSDDQILAPKFPVERDEYRKRSGVLEWECDSAYDKASDWGESEDALIGKSRAGGEIELRTIKKSTATEVEPFELESETPKPLESKPPIRPSWIILGALVTMVGFQQLTGWSAPFGIDAIIASGRRKESAAAPEQGDCFTNTAQQFADLVASLEGTHSRDWTGESATGYADATAQLTAAAQQISDLDTQTHDAVQSHADTVNQTRLLLEIEQDALIAMYVMVRFQECYCVFGPFPLWLWGWAIGVAGIAVAAGLAEVTLCSEKSTSTAKQASVIDYNQATAAALQAMAAYLPAPAGPPLTASVKSATRHAASASPVSHSARR